MEGWLGWRGEGTDKSAGSRFMDCSMGYAIFAEGWLSRQDGGKEEEEEEEDVLYGIWRDVAVFQKFQ